LLPQLRLRDFPREIWSRKTDRKFVQVAAASWPDHFGKLADVVAALVGLEEVIEPGVDHGAKGQPEGRRMECICDAKGEPITQVWRGGPALVVGLRNGFLDEIDAERLEPALGKVESEITGPAPGVENGPLRWIVIEQSRHRGLR